jgi:hypothetical protein
VSNGNRTIPPTPIPEIAAIETIQQPGVIDSPLAMGAGSPIDGWLLAYDPNRLSLPPWWSKGRDRVLRQYVRSSLILSSVVYQRAAVNKNTGWRIEVKNDQAEPSLDHYTALIQNAQFGEGFRAFIELVTQDLLCQDNGAFIELIGEGEEQAYSYGGQTFRALGWLPKERIIGFAHIDSAQVWRTNNREFPFVYTNPWNGKFTILHWSRMIGLSQLTQPIQRGRGIGLCAASRAFAALEIMETSNQYVTEKMTGQSPEIAIAKGVAIEAIRAALKDNAIERDARGMVRYKGIAFVEGDHLPSGDPSIQIVGIKNTPDGWEREKEMTLSIYMIAMAFATDVRDLGWAAQYAGDTKADAEVQDQKTANRGRADIMRDLADVITRRILPPGLAFEFDEQDDLADRHKAEIEHIRAQTRSLRITSGEITPHEAREIAAKTGDLDQRYLASHVVSDESSNPLVELPEEKATSFSSLHHQFMVKFRAALNRYRKTGNFATLLNECRPLINNYGTRAFLQGVNDGGARGAKLSDLTAEELGKMQSLIQQQIDYLNNLRGLEIDSRAVASERAELWANKGLDHIYFSGMLAGNQNANLEWFLGATEKHCRDCLKYAGRVYRAKTWEKHKIVPRSGLLECKGYRCDCRFERSDKPLNRGRPPSPSGAKKGQHHHEH